MRRRPQTIYLLLVLMFLGIGIYWFRVVLPRQRSAAQLVAQLKRDVDPEALRSWAMENIRGERFGFGEAVTNGPAAAITIRTRPPRAVAFRDDADPSREYVLLSWGRDLPSVAIGSTNFVGHSGDVWKSGIYVKEPTMQ